jgi:hypothetical protein
MDVGAIYVWSIKVKKNMRKRDEVGFRNTIGVVQKLQASRLEEPMCNEQLLSWTSSSLHRRHYCRSVFLRKKEFKCVCSEENQKNNTRDSNVVPHRSTNLARRCLTSQSGRDAVLSSLYGRSC